MKKYADNKRFVKPNSFSEGDKVIVKRDPSIKKSGPPYDPDPYVINTTKRNYDYCQDERERDNTELFFF